MKKLFPIVITALFIFSSSPLRAETPRLDRVQEQSQMRQENRQERRDGFLETHATRLENRFAFYYQRLMKLADKLQAAIDSSSKDTTAAQENLDAAKAKLADAKATAESSVAQFRAIEPDKYETQRQLALSARDTANKARVLFKEAKELLISTIKALR